MHFKRAQLDTLEGSIDYIRDLMTNHGPDDWHELHRRVLSCLNDMDNVLRPSSQLSLLPFEAKVKGSK